MSVTPDPDEQPDRPAVREVRARTRLLAAMRPRATRSQLLAAVLCAGLGFGLVVQVQQNQGLENLSQTELVRILDQVNGDAERLQKQELAARAARDRLADRAGAGQEAEQQARERLVTLGILGGTVPARGPGIELLVNDPRGEVSAAILLDTLQELRDAGAEAVQIGDVRVVASTAFVDDTGGVAVGPVLQRPPYRFRAIGDPATLDAAMRIPGGVLDVLEQKGAAGTVVRKDEVLVDAVHRLAPPRFASPAPEPAS